MMIWRVAVVMATAGSLFVAGSAHAEVACIKVRGGDRPIKVRPSCRANEEQIGSFAALRLLLAALSSEDGGATLRLSGVNLQVVSGAGATGAAPNGRGNLIVGYNEPPFGASAEDRAGSHNLVVGVEHRYRSWGGLVAGEANTLAGELASVSGGTANTAAGRSSSVSGGGGNRATGQASSVSGGISNTATDLGASVSGGAGNSATDEAASVSGGHLNVAGCASDLCVEAAWASVSGGSQNAAEGVEAWIGGGVFNRVLPGTSAAAVVAGLSNQATGWSATVCGGQDNVAGPYGDPTDTAGDPLFTNSATVCGGRRNRARGNFSVVGGGADLTIGAVDGWAAGSLGGGGPFVGPHRSE